MAVRSKVVHTRSAVSLAWAHREPTSERDDRSPLESLEAR